MFYLQAFFFFLTNASLGVLLIPVKSCQGGWIFPLKTHWLYHNFSHLTLLFFLGLDQEIEIVEGECPVLQFSQNACLCFSLATEVFPGSHKCSSLNASVSGLLPERNGKCIVGTSVVLLSFGVVHWAVEQVLSSLARVGSVCSRVWAHECPRGLFQ